MFQGLRQGAPFYVFSKKEMKMDIGEVTFVSNPMPAYGYSMSFPVKNTVDVKVDIDGQTIDFQKLPSDSVIADFDKDGIVVSEDCAAIINEVRSHMKISERHMAENGYHEKVLDEGPKILAKLDPGARKEAEQAEEMQKLKNELVDIKAMLAMMVNKDSPKNNE